jgi:hypothetical protein
MDDSWITQHLERIDKRNVRKIITAAVKGQELPVTIRQATSGNHSNKYMGKRKALR